MVCGEDNTSLKYWKEYIGHRDNVLLEGFDVFNNFLIITERENGKSIGFKF